MLPTVHWNKNITPLTSDLISGDGWAAPISRNIWVLSDVLAKVKVKFTVDDDIYTQRGSEGIVLLFL